MEIDVILKTTKNKFEIWLLNFFQANFDYYTFRFDNPVKKTDITLQKPVIWPDGEACLITITAAIHEEDKTLHKASLSDIQHFLTFRIFSLDADRIELLIGWNHSFLDEFISNFEKEIRYRWKVEEVGNEPPEQIQLKTKSDNSGNIQPLDKKPPVSKQPGTVKELKREVPFSLDIIDAAVSIPSPIFFASGQVR